MCGDVCLLRNLETPFTSNATKTNRPALSINHCTETVQLSLGANTQGAIASCAVKMYSVLDWTVHVGVDFGRLIAPHFPLWPRPSTSQSNSEPSTSPDKPKRHPGPNTSDVWGLL